MCIKIHINGWNLDWLIGESNEIILVEASTNLGDHKIAVFDYSETLSGFSNLNELIETSHGVVEQLEKDLGLWFGGPTVDDYDRDEDEPYRSWPERGEFWFTR